MLDRGKCSNVVKVRNVENFGGAVALIADYKEEDVDDLIMTDYAGSGYSLTIPGFMIDHDAGLKIKDALSDNTQVIVKAQLTMSLPSNDIEVGIFYSSSLDFDSKNMETFSELAFKSAKSRKEPLLSLRIHSFGCPLCP